MRPSVLATLSCALLVAACSSAPQEPSSGPTPNTPPSPVATTPEARTGFVHALEHSRFRVGASPFERFERGAREIVGDEGVFSTRPTGLVLAISNADAPTRGKAPLAGGADAHDEQVRSYFVSAGLPADQILSVSPYAVVSKMGRGSPDLATRAAEGPPKLEYYFTTITRQIDGIKIADSFAWARLDADGTAVLESVYWPPIPAEVMRGARAAEARLRDTSFKATLLTKLPRDGQLVIHHAPGEWDGPLSATVSYDVAEEQGKVSHFDLEGGHIELAYEAERAWGDIPTASRR
jgi:hypothetical protein